VLLRVVTCSVAVLFGSLLTGCSAGSDPGALYLQRLSGALDVAVVPADRQTRFAPLPLGNELRIPYEGERLSLVDVPALYDCDLSSLIGLRNAPMGRVQRPSQRFAYDLGLIAGIDACEAPGETLQRLRKRRVAQLPVAAFNALFGDTEWHAFVTVPVALSVTETRLEPDVAQEVGRSLQTLDALFAQPLVDAAKRSGRAEQELEERLATLRRSQALGRQRAQWLRHSDVLERAIAMLEIAYRENPGCLNGQPTPAGRIRQNVFHTYYAQGMQPLLTEQGHPDRGWLLAANMLINTVLEPLEGNARADRLRHWQQAVLGIEPAAEYGRFRAALATHTRLWQRQLGVCGLMPTPP